METPPTPDNEIELKLEKLRLEIDEMKRNGRWNRRFGRFIPLLSALVPVLALLFAVQQFRAQQDLTTRALDRQTMSDKQAAERAFMRPVIERQMNIYFDASAAAATLASSQNPDEQKKARDDFLRLFWGPLVMLESPEVTHAMNEFKRCLDRNCGELQDLSLALASTFQSDLFNSGMLTPEAYAKRSIDYVQERAKRLEGKNASATPSPLTDTPNAPSARVHKSGTRHVMSGPTPTGPGEPAKVTEPKVTAPKVIDSKMPDPKVPDPKMPDPKVPDPKRPN